MTQAVISHRYNGPPQSGNGGYSCGLLAAHVSGPARVRLHVPPPLDTPLRIEYGGDGDVAMYDGETLVGTGVPAPLSLDIPDAPSLAAASAAMAGYICRDEHAFPTCFVCGPDRPADDGLGLYPGPVNDNTLLACTWEPRDDMLDDAGNVKPEIIWAALDCPGYFAAMEGELRPALLGELLGEIRGDIPGSAPLIVYSWPLGQDGRKYYGGTAIANTDGEVLACSHSTWIELRA